MPGGQRAALEQLKIDPTRDDIRVLGPHHRSG
jgi:hypothetical protein